MKLALLAVCVGAFLAVPGIAAADPAQGRLTGSAFIGTPLNLSFAITSPVLDGGTDPLYIGKENDKSGNCNNDSGTVVVANASPFNVVCAHFVASSGCCNTGSPKMRFAYQVATLAIWEVIRITDNGDSPDTFAFGSTTTLAGAQAWVNTGRKGSGHSSMPWTFGPVMDGNYTVLAHSDP